MVELFRKAPVLNQETELLDRLLDDQGHAIGIEPCWSSDGERLVGCQRRRDSPPDKLAEGVGLSITGARIGAPDHVEEGIELLLARHGPTPELSLVLPAFYFPEARDLLIDPIPELLVLGGRIRDTGPVGSDR